MNNILVKALGILAVFGAPGVAQAQISGSIEATITLEPGCYINGEPEYDEEVGVDFGSINFGTHPTNFSTAEAEVAGGAGIEIQCAAETTPKLIFRAGLNDGSGAATGLKAMKHGTLDEYVSYDLLTDGDVIIDADDEFELATDGSPTTFIVKGVASGTGTQVAGTYTDTVAVEITL